MLIVLFGFCINLYLELEQKEIEIQKVWSENQELQLKISKINLEIESMTAFVKNLTTYERAELKNISWDELKGFLRLDKTNELVYNEDRFDCTGFALKLYENARLLGIKSGFVEVEFENESYGHILNAFQTDKGIIFIDVTGNENGTGTDKVAYIQIGKAYGVIDIGSLKERLAKCDVSCESMAKGLSYIELYDVFSYTYFEKYYECVEFYEKCVDVYNAEVEKYNRGKSSYSYKELKTWYDSIDALEMMLFRENISTASKGSVVKKLNIYW